MQVVVVESPAKAKTIGKYLGEGYTVLASYGHVSDLPSRNGSVRPDDDFDMTFETGSKALKPLGEIARALGKAEALVLATDPDREGEAIAWHVRNWLDDNGATGDRAVKRVVFNEITREAVTEAMASPRDIDMDLVNAQLARRALDYLIGFTLSPVLWQKLPGCDCRSAGRVQSVALRLICEREAEIERFTPREYWTVDADLATGGGDALTARLVRLGGGKLDKFDLADEAAANDAARVVREGAFTVENIEQKETRRSPAAPFTTSTLQQEASRRLKFGVQKTMSLAQRLYEGRDIGGEATGLITYMRTDSVVMSRAAIGEARRHVGAMFGASYLPEKPRTYRTKARNAQEAHEAIRPTDFGRTPKDMARHLEKDEARLYDIIWKRALASQMESARFHQTTVDISTTGREDAGLRASGSVMLFDGFMKLYREASDEDDGGERRLPRLSRDEPLGIREVRPEQHFTEPPPRLNEATLVRRLEELGIGRPSTYAPIINVLKSKEYVTLEARRFRPADRGRLLVAFLEAFFRTYVEYDFTANLERDLDRISSGNADWKAVLREFWDAFDGVIRATRDLDIRNIVEAIETVLEHYIFPAEGDRDPRTCPSCETGRLNLRLGKFGPFIGCTRWPECRYTKDPFARDGGPADEPLHLGDDPATGQPVTFQVGKFGPYVRSGEAGPDSRTVSVPRTMAAAAITLEKALGLLALPRDVGAHPETGTLIQAGVGRYGPYLRHGRAYVNIDDDDVLEIGLNRAVALIAEKGRKASASVLRTLGEHPADKEAVEIVKGRYGPCVRHKRTFATLPKGTAADDVTLEAAIELLARKKKKPAGAGRHKRRTPRKSAAG